MVKDYQTLNHTKWDCKYHVIFMPKRRAKQIYGAIRKHLVDVFHELAKQKVCIEPEKSFLLPGWLTQAFKRPIRPSITATSQLGPMPTTYFRRRKDISYILI
jgi:putative transposase